MLFPWLVKHHMWWRYVLGLYLFSCDYWYVILTAQLLYVLVRYGHQFLNHFLRCISLATHFSSKQVLFLGWFSCKNLLEKKASGEWSARLAVAPLFETIPDLEVLFTRLWLWTFFYYVHSSSLPSLCSLVFLFQWFARFMCSSMEGNIFQ